MSYCISLPCSDTLFLEDFSFTDFVAKFDELRCSEVGGALVSCYNCKDNGVCVCVAVCYIVAHLMHFISASETTKFGIVEVDGEGKICKFLEKPSPDATQSRRAVR